jgi:hypothetical protein
MATSFLAVFAAGLLTSGSATSVANYTYSIEPGQLFVPAMSPSGKAIDPQAAVHAISESTDVRSVTAIDGARNPGTDDYAPDSATLFATAVIPDSQACPVDADGESDIAYNAKDPRRRDQHSTGAMWSQVIPRVVVGDADALAAVLGHSPSAEAKRELAEGGAVALHRQLLADGSVTIGWSTAFGTGHAGNRAADAHNDVTVDAVYEKTEHQIDVLAVLSPAAAARAGIHPVPMGALVQFNGDATQTQLDAVNGALQRLSGDPSAWAQYETGPQTGAQDAIARVALASSAFLALCAAGVALALARSDGRRDVEVVAAVGAAPGIRRRYAAWQAAVITGVGMLLGALTGTIGTFAIEGTSATDLFVMPWSAIAVAVGGTTLVIAAISWLTAGRGRSSMFRTAIA